ncbi:hypothetical protein ACN3XK_68495, partial [Actinomadura welshii]
PTDAGCLQRRPADRGPTTEQTDTVSPCPACCGDAETADFANRAGSGEMVSPPGRRRASGIGTALPTKAGN